MIAILNKATIYGRYIVIDKLDDFEPIDTQDNIKLDDIKTGNSFDLKESKPIRNFYIGDYYYYLFFENITKNEDNTYDVKNPKNGCIVELYDSDDTVEVFPSIKEFCYTFELPYSFGLNRQTNIPVIWNGKPCDVRYPKTGEIPVTYQKMTEHSFLSRCDALVKNYLKCSMPSEDSNNDDTGGIIKNCFTWNYNTHNRFDEKYAVNIINRQQQREVINYSNNERYAFMKLILDCLANMILYKAEHDRQFPPSEEKYNYKWSFTTLEDVKNFFKDNPATTRSLLTCAMQMLLKPKDSNVVGIALGYDIAYIYMTSQKDKHDAHELSETYVDKHFNLKIKNKTNKNIPYAY